MPRRTPRVSHHGNGLVERLGAPVQIFQRYAEARREALALVSRWERFVQRRVEQPYGNREGRPFPEAWPLSLFHEGYSSSERPTLFSVLGLIIRRRKSAAARSLSIKHVLGTEKSDPSAPKPRALDGSSGCVRVRPDFQPASASTIFMMPMKRVLGSSPSMASLSPYT